MSLLGKKGFHTHIVENLKSKIDFNILLYLRQSYKKLQMWMKNDIKIIQFLSEPFKGRRVWIYV